ncbi:DUF4097 family beta strand repeat-containing protein [Halosolutus gelatinilyticus]|uniref:DUF4097 family beta strand repeat-containing protein n=1 Tax=Halosolutus gelatinilyticus TaxID=2931975 RepID=UPI001FF23CFF|nr:DUF4097 family beta strand repeat-containing protein [Halosolutus gelatinilyticus]
MDSTITRRRVFLAGTVVSIGGLALGGIATGRVLDEGSDTRTTETFSETYDVAEISVATDVGPVSVIGTDRETVELVVEQRGTEGSLDRTTLSIDEGNDALDVTVEYDHTTAEWLGLTAESRPDIKTVLTVPHELEHAALETVNGAIDASALESTLAASTTKGEIDVGVETLGDGTTIETTNGDVAVAADAIEGDATFESTNGAITYALGDTTDATVTVATSSGDIALTTDRADPVRRTDTELEATVGDGTHQLQFETTSGDVTITD